LYADTPESNDPAQQLEKLKNRVTVEGFTWLKMDLGIHLLADKSGSLVNYKYWTDKGFENAYSGKNYMDYWNQEHSNTQIQISDVRNAVGTEVPLCCDHFGYMDMNQIIRMGKALDKYRLAWLEDVVAWFYTDMWKDIKAQVETPLCTGEDIYMLSGMLGGFKKLIDSNAVDIIHPDLVSAGGILETKKIADYAEEVGIPAAFHANSTPVAFMANVHCAAATENFLVLEHHNADNPWWGELVKMTGSQPMITSGYANVPLDAPGLGIELNDENVKARMRKDSKYFDATPEWDSIGSTYDKLWI
jgi:L-alanine-DL-glutamate epimerase-like enolase superfamily enzyme